MGRKGGGGVKQVKQFFNTNPTLCSPIPSPSMRNPRLLRILNHFLLLLAAFLTSNMSWKHK